MTINQRFKNWIPAWIMMTVIFMFSSIPGQVIRASGFNKESYHVDGHFLLFFLLGVSYFKATKKPIMSWVLVLIYALLDEFHQGFVPLRSVSIEDILVDITAGFISLLIIWKLSRILPKKLNDWLRN